MIYTVGEVAKKLGIAPSALRYYDKEGLLPFLKRSSGGIRVFTEQDFSGLAIIHCLKQTGMPIKDIKRFMDMVQEGDGTIEERLELFQKQRENVKKQMEELNKALDVLDYKCWYYECAREKGNTSSVDEMGKAEMPEKYAAIKERMRSLV
ncbi:MAG: MerR family transcriptional regulator [Lachnospiraceae bacterium]|nr:MerR family transcriptional regulator [Lachnospiraceae bacterium]